MLRQLSDRVTKSSLYGVGMQLVSIVMVLVAAPFRTTRAAVFVVSLAFALQILGAAVGLVSVRRRSHVKPDPKARILLLSRSLEEAAKIIEEIKAEVANDAATLDKLKRQVEVQQQLAQLTDLQAEAVLEGLRHELSGPRLWWQAYVVNISTGLFFFVVGLVAGRVWN